jgi:hypothetical protein
MQYLIAEGDDMSSEAVGAAARVAVMICRRRESWKRRRRGSTRGSGRKKTSRD